MTDRDRRSSLFREVNARIRELNSGSDVPGPAGFVCECGEAGCTEILDLSVADYDALRATGDGFLVKRGHEAAARASSPTTFRRPAPSTAIAPT